MKTANAARTLMTPGNTGGNASEAMPVNPKNGDEVIAVNVGATYTYTLTGSLTGGNVVLDPGESAILVWVGATWDTTWRSATGTVTYPISLAHGGTGADGTDLWKWLATDAGTDTAKTEFFLSATDSGDSVFNVSVGIELPNSVGLAGDLVIRTGGTGASGSGTERVRVSGLDGVATFSRDSSDLLPAIRLSNAFALSSPSYVTMEGGSATGAMVGAAGLADFSNDGSGVAAFLQATATQPAFQMSPNGTGSFFVSDSNNNGRVAINGANDGFFVPVAALDVRATLNNDTALFAHSLSGISALFQTSATDGSNANPTQVIAGNTGQTAPLTEWRFTDGETPIGRFTLNSLWFDTNNGIIGVMADGPLLIKTSSNPDGSESGQGGNFGIQVSDGTTVGGTGNYNIYANGGLHEWVNTPDGMAYNIMNFDNTGKLSGMAMVDALAFSVGAVPGVSGTITAASTVSVVNGIVTSITP